MNSCVTGKSGYNPIVSPFFSEIQDVEEHAKRTEAVYKIALSALDNGIDGKIPDPIVGDEGCQIRALYFATKMQEHSFKRKLQDTKAIIEKQIADVMEIQEKIKSINSQCDAETKEMKAQLKSKINMKKRLSREKFNTLQALSEGSTEKESAEKEYTFKIDAIQQEIVQIKSGVASTEKKYGQELDKLKEQFFSETSFPEEVWYYLCSDILTQVKKERTEVEIESGDKIGHDDIDHRILGRGLVSSETSRIVKIAQRMLANLSVDYIQEEVAKCQSSDKELLKQMVSRVKVIKHNSHGSHKEMPCFHYTRVVFQRAIEQQIPVILKVRNVKGDPFKPEDFSSYTVFKVNTGNKNYEPVVPESISPDTMAIVMECRTTKPDELVKKSTFIEELMIKAGGIVPLIEHLVAQHTQYTDQKKMTGGFQTYYDEIEMPETEKKKVIAMGHYAAEIGIAPANPSLCCPEHIYCNTIGSEMKTGVSYA